MICAHGGIKMESILVSIKKLLGIPVEDTCFDGDLIIHINSVFLILNQLGIGENPFSISDSSAVWSDFIDDGKIELVKSYMFLKVKLLFDPPQNGSLIEAMNKQINEFEWRVNVATGT